MERTTSAKIILRGGLDSQQNHLRQSDEAPGTMTEMVNFEPSLYGGYRRINGFVEWDEEEDIDDANAEGKLYCCVMYHDIANDVAVPIVARKQQSGATYKFYYYTSGSGWSAYTHDSRSTTGVLKVRHARLNVGGTNWLIFVDGVNDAIAFNGTTWYTLDSGNTGGSGSPGGDQILDKPAWVAVFKNHVFVGKDPDNPHLLAHSAPNDPLTWTTAAGGGQIITGFVIACFKAFRNALYVFAENAIKSVTVSGTDFVLEDVTTDIGCIAPDSLVEIGGDLLFLAPDGFRPVAGTARIGDVELQTVSRRIQSITSTLSNEFDLETSVNALVVPSKTQVRFFFGDDTKFSSASSGYGIIGALRTMPGEDLSWEWGELYGIRASCTDNSFIKRTEYLLVGDYDGKLYRHEQGNSFNGESIIATLRGPYYDFGDTEVRKTPHKLHTHIRPEGAGTIYLQLAFDWGTLGVSTPSDYETALTANNFNYNAAEAIYNATGIVYGGANLPIITTDIQGSHYSVRPSFVSIGTDAPFTIQGFVFEFKAEDRR